VPLSFDDAAMEVLELLDDAPFEWDMFVDLQDNAIRYCFCTLTDAMAFRLRFGNASERRAGASGQLSAGGRVASSGFNVVHLKTIVATVAYPVLEAAGELPAREAVTSEAAATDVLTVRPNLP
jgi:hypothetical protein